MTIDWRPDAALSSMGSDASGVRRRSVTIGVVNNMPDAAFQATVDQFDDLLARAAGDDIDVRLRFFVQPERKGAVTGRYESADALWTARIDGLIVTGAEPQAPRMMDEPCLPFLARIVDWAEDNVVPVMWSCLAAHAAVYRLDGIERRRRETKLFGVFACDKVMDHFLLDNVSAPWLVPHSRFNELPEAELAACGYRVLTRSTEIGIDSFIKQTGTLHVFMNGHPEYGETTLRSEYRRDIRRFLKGEHDRYPTPPTGYFPDDATPILAAFHDRALGHRTPTLMADFPSVTPAARLWRVPATGLFRNWLLRIARPAMPVRLTIARPFDAIDEQPGADRAQQGGRTK